MAEKDDPTAEVEQEVQKRSIGREILGAAAAEMGFAVNSIRQEVVEKGWFGERKTPEFVREWSKEEPEQGSLEGPQDFSRDDFYGHDVEGPEPDRERDPDIER